MNTINRIKSSFKHFYEPLFIVLFLFILIIGSFIFNENDINTKEQQYNHTINLIYKIQMLDNNIEAFIENSARFVNYDDIVSKINLNNQLIEELKNQEIYLDFKDIIDDLDNKWKLKIENIERYKSTNASVISLSSYIIRFSKKIEETYMLNSVRDVLLLDQSLSVILSSLINENNLKDIRISQSLKNLQNLSKIYNNEEFKFFYKRLKLLVKYLNLLVSLKSDISSINLDENLHLLNKQLDIIKNFGIKKQKNLTNVLFFISFIILFVLFTTYKDLANIKRDLKSFKLAVENSDNSIVITNEKKEIVFVNEAFEEVTGYTKAEVLGKNPSILKSGKMPQKYYENLNKTIYAGKKWIGEFINITKYKEVYHERSSITPIKSDNEIVGFLAIKLDITDYIKKKEKAKFLANHDSLTLLGNRRYLEMKVNELIKASKRDFKKFAFFFLDLDGFKNINDTLGHDAGDILLKEIAKRFKELLRETDYIFRIAGDEFIALIYYENENDINIVANKIIETINLDFIIKDSVVNVGCSIGISKFPQDANNLEDLMKYSDIAMYEAKRRGKNQFVLYSKKS